MTAACYVKRKIRSERIGDDKEVEICDKMGMGNINHEASVTSHMVHLR